MQGMISVDNSKAAVGLLGKLLQLSYIEQCILLDHIEDGMTIEDLVASLKSSASHEAKSIAKRIEALSEELNGSGEQDMANVAEEMGIKMPDIDRKSMVDADIEAVKQNVIMGISCTKHPGEDAWEPTITAARLLEKAEKALLRDADAYFAQRAAQEALSLLKANEPQIEQLHVLLREAEDAMPRFFIAFRAFPYAAGKESAFAEVSRQDKLVFLRIARSPLCREPITLGNSSKVAHEIYLLMPAGSIYKCPGQAYN